MDCKMRYAGAELRREETDWMHKHIPILEREVVEALRPEDPAVKRLVDGTVGGGGHTLALLRAGIHEALCIDRDRSALDHARRKLSDFADRVCLVHGSYIDMAAESRLLGWDTVDAILLDLGLSSLQLDEPARGFSFRFDAPLDMRFDHRSSGMTAQDLVNGLPEAELANLLYRYGEERRSRQIASAIVAQRPLQTTSQLAETVARAKRARTRSAAKTHPATKVFQALRISVNGELEALERALPIAVGLLCPGGRLAVISFHSLEDRIVKQTFKRLSTTVSAPPGMASIGAAKAQIRLVNRKPIKPSREEIEANPRSRSAKLRVVEKLEWA